MEPQAAQLTELVKDWPEINHLYMIENFLRRLVPEEVSSLCDLSLTLTDTGAIMMVLEAVHEQQSGACQAAAMEVTEKINQSSDDADALKPVARTARLLAGLGGSMVQSSLSDQTALVTGDVEKMRADTANKMAGSYNNQMKSVESYGSGVGTGVASVATVLATTLTVTILLLL